MLRKLPVYLIFIILRAFCWSSDSVASTMTIKEPKIIPLPEPALRGNISIESAINARRSIRSFSREPLSRTDMAQLLWSAQGITDRQGFRAAPSAGALYPLEIYLVAGSIKGLEPAVYRYVPAGHSLVQVKAGDIRDTLTGAALGQQSIARAPASLVIAAVYQRTARKYGARAERYVHIEAGHAAQNILLQAAAIELGTVVIGAFEDDTVKKVLNLPADNEPLTIIPIGFPKSPGFPWK